MSCLEILAAWVSAIATALIAVFARTQLRAIKQTAQADFIHRLETDFFTEKTRPIVRAAATQQLKFCPNDDDPYFTFGNAEEWRISGYELDDFVLGPLEDIGILERRRLVDQDMVGDIFGWYIKILWQNEAIAAYVQMERKRYPDGDIYRDLERLYKKLNPPAQVG